MDYSDAIYNVELYRFSIMDSANLCLDYPVKKIRIEFNKKLMKAVTSDQPIQRIVLQHLNDARAS